MSAIWRTIALYALSQKKTDQPITITQNQTVNTPSGVRYNPITVAIPEWDGTVTPSNT